MDGMFIGAKAFKKGSSNLRFKQSREFGKNVWVHLKTGHIILYFYFKTT